MYRLLITIIAALAFMPAPAFAKGAVERWTVTQISGDAQVLHSGRQPVALKTNAALSPGDVIVTGVNGRAIITRASSYVIVAPRSRLELPAGEQRAGMTRFIQQFGTMLYKVRRMGTPHFEVETPMLAAVVKGTTFTVIVDKDRSAVQVTEGAVEVTAALGGMKSLVEGGHTVFIDRNDPKLLAPLSNAVAEPAGDGDGETISIKASADEPLSTIATLTGGLVREDPVVLASAAMVESALTPTVMAATVTAPPAETLATVESQPAAPAPVAAEPAPAASAPPATTPVATAPAATTPVITTPAAVTPVATTPAVATPVITTPAVTVLPVTTPEISKPGPTLPQIILPIAVTPSGTVPGGQSPVVSVPVATVPAVTTPVITTPAVTVPAEVSKPGPTLPQITLPIAVTPSGTVPGGKSPVVSVPGVTLPEVTKLKPPSHPRH